MVRCQFLIEQVIVRVAGEMPWKLPIATQKKMFQNSIVIGENNFFFGQNILEMVCYAAVA